MKNAELHRLIQNMTRIGTIAELDTAARKVKVKTGDNITAWLAWPADVGGNYVRWRPLRLNSQVILLSPSGDISQGQIVGQLYTPDTTPAATAETIDAIEFDDGTTISYDSENSVLTVDASGSVVVNCTDVAVTASGSAVVDAGTGASVITDGDASIEAAGNATVDAAAVTLNGGSAGGVVCQSHVCAFTGSPHPQASLTVTAGN